MICDLCGEEVRVRYTDYSGEKVCSYCLEIIQKAKEEAGNVGISRTWGYTLPGYPYSHKTNYDQPVTEKEAIELITKSWGVAPKETWKE